MTPPARSDDELVENWRVITSAVIRTQRRIDRVLEESGTPLQWVAVLTLLLRSAEHRMPMSALAREVSMTAGGFTKLADRMAREGLIDRRGSTADRRVVNATLTESGRTLAQQVSERYDTVLRDAVEQVVPAEQLAAVAATLRPLRTAHAEALEIDEHDLRATQRGPALPDRRGRGHDDV